MNQDQTLVNKVAEAIVAEFGWSLDELYMDKQEWIDDRGKRCSLDLPFRNDVYDAARAAIRVIRETDNR